MSVVTAANRPIDDLSRDQKQALVEASLKPIVNGDEAALKSAVTDVLAGANFNDDTHYRAARSKIANLRIDVGKLLKAHSGHNLDESKIFGIFDACFHEGLTANGSQHDARQKLIGDRLSALGVTDDALRDKINVIFENQLVLLDKNRPGAASTPAAPPAVAEETAIVPEVASPLAPADIRRELSRDALLLPVETLLKEFPVGAMVPVARPQIFFGVHDTEGENLPTLPPSELAGERRFEVSREFLHALITYDELVRGTASAGDPVLRLKDTIDGDFAAAQSHGNGYATINEAGGQFLSIVHNHLTELQAQLTRD